MEKIITTLTILTALIVGLGVGLMTNEVQVVEKEVPVITEKLVIVEKVVKANDSRIDDIHKEVLREDNEESLSEDLAIEELEDKGFKKELATFLMDNVALLDIDYKDIKEYSIRDVDVEVSGKEATVEVEFNVYVENYGDSDEEEKARVKAVFTVEELDEDEDYEDAEVVEDYGFEFIRFYD